MNEKEILEIADALKCEEYKRGEIVLHEKNIFLIMIKKFLVYFVKSGSIDLLYNEHRVAATFAIIDCQLLMLNRADFNHLLSSVKNVLKCKAELDKIIVKDIQNKHK
jgi:CRP-like cAMP-binding protein